MNKHSLEQYISATSGQSCPQCQSVHFTKNGKENGTQRYKCKTCGRCYRDSNQTPIYRIQKKELIKKYTTCIQNGYSLRKAARETGISLPTAFKWRHKLISALNTGANITTQRKITASVLPIAYSEKGQKTKSAKTPQSTQNLLFFDNQGQIIIESIYKRTKTDICLKTAKITKGKIVQHLQNKETSAKIRTASNAIYSKTACKDILFTSNEIQIWLDKFRGVATKYLQNYWNWYMHEVNTSINQTCHNFCYNQLWAGKISHTAPASK